LTGASPNSVSRKGRAAAKGGTRGKRLGPRAFEFGCVFFGTIRDTAKMARLGQPVPGNGRQVTKQLLGQKPSSQLVEPKKNMGKNGTQFNNWGCGGHSKEVRQKAFPFCRFGSFENQNTSFIGSWTTGSWPARGPAPGRVVPVAGEMLSQRVQQNGSFRGGGGETKKHNSASRTHGISRSFSSAFRGAFKKNLFQFHFGFLWFGLFCFSFKQKSIWAKEKRSIIHGPGNAVSGQTSRAMFVGGIHHAGGEHIQALISCPSLPPGPGLFRPFPGTRPGDRGDPSQGILAIISYHPKLRGLSF